METKVKRLKLAVIVCTGNVCRSPIAEYMLRQRIGVESGWEISSAGVAAIKGSPASEMAIRVMKERGIDISAHRSRPFDAEIASKAAVIFVMTRDQQKEIVSRYPSTAEKVFLLKSFHPSLKGDDIIDPIGFDIERYREVCNEIYACLSGVVSFIKKLEVS